MVEDLRKKPSGKQPISHHPLFPATVALWFGALFGLASLAIRPAILEQAVLAMRLDTIIAAAAPPLGVTARILLALVMAGAGVVLGTLLARRIARPRPVVRERKRDAAFLFEAEQQRSSFGSLSARDEANETATSAKASAQRRRNLTMTETATDDYPEHAPLPGGNPQILNVAEFDLEGFEDPVQWSEKDRETAAPSADANTGIGGDHVEQAVPALQTLPEDAQVFASGEPARDGDETFDDEIRETSDEASDIAASDPSPASSIARPGFTLFERMVAQDTVKNHDENEPPLSATPDGEPFAEPVAPPFSVADEEQDETDASAAEDLSPDKNSQSTDSIDAERPDEIGHEMAEASADPSPDSPSKDFSAPHADLDAGRIESADLSDLSHVELLERLALSMERRRAQIEAERAALAAAVSATTDVGESIAPPDAEAQVEPSTSVITTPEEWKNADPGEQQGMTTPAPFASPDGDEQEETFVPPPVTVPAALRPVGLDDDDDFDLLPNLVPPRRFTMPDNAASAAASTQASGPVLADNFADGRDDEARTLEQGYSSLLSLSRPASERPQFVRIEEPEQGDGEIKPVVIFPGDDRQPAAPFTRPEGAAAAQSARFAPESMPNERRFDPPVAAPGADEDSAGAPARQPDPEETERALRAALATLQKMSGAA